MTALNGSRRAAHARLFAAAALLAGTALASPAAAAPSVHRVAAARQAAPNPLVGLKWGTYKGNADPAWPPYEASTGKTHRMLAKIALTPKAKWFGRWLTVKDIGPKVTEYIHNATGGNPNVLVQMTFFDMNPWEQEACTRLPTQHERSQYLTWIRHAAHAIGNTHALIVQQPDGPFAQCAPHGSHVYERLIAQATAILNALPNTVVYIEGGSTDWMRGSLFNNARRCATRSETHCVALGIPPTTDVANPEWGLPGRVARLAKRNVDAYLWVSRPWVTPVGETFDMKYALRVVRTARYPIPRY